MEVGQSAVQRPGVRLNGRPDTRDAAWPVVQQASFTLADGDGAAAANIYTVPSGHELVIEQVSIGAAFNSGQRLSSAAIHVVGGGQEAVFLVPQDNAVDSTDGLTHSAGDIQTRIYADPGTTVSCSANRSGTVGGGFGSCSISGYLVPLR